MTENGCAAAQEAAPSASTNGAAAAPVIVEQQLVAMPILQQDGEVFVGPGSLKEAELLGLGLRRLRTREKDDLANAKKFAQEVSVKAIMMRQQQNEQAKQQKIAMYQQALALMSRIYIGSISFEAREDHLRQVFGWYGPIKTINVQYDGSTGHHKGYAFLEYEVPEAAQLAINQLNGYLLCGRNLKVNAQTQQNQQQWAGAPTAPGVVAPLQNAQNIIQLVMQEAAQYHRIYVASVHPDLSETDLKSVFEAFGEVKNCRLARNLANPRVHRGFGYITYNNAQACREAVAGMNGFDLGGQQLRVGKAITPPDVISNYEDMHMCENFQAISYLAPAATQALPSAAALAAAAITAKIQAQEAVRPAKTATSPMKPVLPPPGSEERKKKKKKKKDNKDKPLRLGYEKLGKDDVKKEDAEDEAEDGGETRALAAIKNEVESDDDEEDTEPEDEDQTKTNNDEGGKDVENFEAPPPPPPPPPEITSAAAVPKVEESQASAAPLRAAHLPAPGIWIPPGTSVSAASGGAQGDEEDEEDNEPPPPTSVLSLFDKMSKGIGKKKQKRLAKQEKVALVQQVIEEERAQASGGDPLMLTYGSDKISEQRRLAISGVPSSMALELYDSNDRNKQIVALTPEEKKKKEEAKIAKIKENYQHSLIAQIRRNERDIRRSKIRGKPKLKTAGALEALKRVGAINDELAANQSEEATSLEAMERVEIRGNDARHLLMTKLMRVNRSQVIVMKNMVTPSEVDDQLEVEIKEECEKFGRVDEVVIAENADLDQVAIFVRFSEAVEATEAQRALNDRFFGGRKVEARIYDQALYEYGDYSHAWQV